MIATAKRLDIIEEYYFSSKLREVRQLASRTSAATVEIVEVVGRNQQLSDGAVSIIERGQQQAKDVTGLVTQARARIDNIQEAAQKVVTAVSQFATRLAK